MVTVQGRFDELLAQRWRRGLRHVDGGVRTRLWEEARQDVARAEKESRAKQAAAEQTERDRLRRALPRMTDRDCAAAFTQIVESFTREHGITIEWRSEMELDGYAHPRKRRIVVPRIAGTRPTCEERFAVCLHEIGHVLSEPCRGGDHRRAKSGACLRCEVLATRRSMQLWPLTRPMFETLRWALGTYRDGSAPKPQTAVAALDTTRGTVHFGQHRMKWLRWTERIRRQELANEGMRHAI